MDKSAHGQGELRISAAAQAKLIPRLIAKVEREKDWVCEVEHDRTSDAEVVVVAYGITSRCARQAVDLARAKGLKAGMLRLITAWPFPEAAFTALLPKVKGWVVSELNLGQMALEVERVVGKSRPVIRVGSAGGELLEPAVIEHAIRRVLA